MSSPRERLPASRFEMSWLTGCASRAGGEECTISGGDERGDTRYRVVGEIGTPGERAARVVGATGSVCSCGRSPCGAEA